MSAHDLLLLPGLTNDARLWSVVATELDGAARPIVGELKSADSMQGLARDVLDKAPRRFALAGLSMGGYCALEIVRQAPERVVALALIDTSARPDGEEAKENRKRQIERSVTAYPDVIEELLPKWVHPSRLREPSVAGVARAMALEAGPEVFTRQMRAIMSRSDSRDLLGTIKCPAVVIAGEDDALMPREIHEELAKGIPGAKLKLIPKCGHLSPLERPTETAAALKEWLVALV